MDLIIIKCFSVTLIFWRFAFWIILSKESLFNELLIKWQVIQKSFMFKIKALVSSRYIVTWTIWGDTSAQCMWFRSSRWGNFMTVVPIVTISSSGRNEKCLFRTIAPHTRKAAAYMQLLPHEVHFSLLQEKKKRENLKRLLPNKVGSESCDEQREGICFSVTVSALVLITNARRYTTMAKASSKVLPQLWFPLFLPFSSSFLLSLCSRGKQAKDPVARKTTLYMKPFTPLWFPVFVDEEFSVKTLSSPQICVWCWLSRLELLMWAFIVKANLKSRK